MVEYSKYLGRGDETQASSTDGSPSHYACVRGALEKKCKSTIFLTNRWQKKLDNLFLCFDSGRFLVVGKLLAFMVRGSRRWWGGRGGQISGAIAVSVLLRHCQTKGLAEWPVTLSGCRTAFCKYKGWVGRYSEAPISCIYAQTRTPP